MTPQYDAMTDHKVVGRDEWQAARDELEVPR